ncbi:precorrin-2 C(20)-methyltransferase [Iocasia frigidifontis]|uniref:precorrin-2 C(20)-methyltransferase n=1 Tax=Iocasia fonsfrigidae TaxID=2682810 RepID=UPI001E311B85|nr:precorrin-2 C(20)-methyltransferase [Iocasia fonsfrigidae]
MQGKLYGVGVGPGDPELLTLKAVKVLKQVDYICVPQTGKDKESLAFSIISKEIDCAGRIIKLYFPMTYKQPDLNQAWDKAAIKMSKELKKGKDLAFITIGDPLLYSTYIYILNSLNKLLVNLRVETVPGISSINACTASCNLPLAENDENIALLSKVDENELEDIFNIFDNVVVMKLSRNYQQVYELLERMELKDNAVIISRCGLEREIHIRDLDSLKVDEIEYLSLLISKQGNCL